LAGGKRQSARPILRSVKVFGRVRIYKDSVSEYDKHRVRRNRKGGVRGAKLFNIRSFVPPIPQTKMTKEERRAWLETINSIHITKRIALGLANAQSEDDSNDRSRFRKYDEEEVVVRENLSDILGSSFSNSRVWS